MNFDHHEDDTGPFAAWAGILALIALAGVIIAGFLLT